MPREKADGFKFLKEQARVKGLLCPFFGRFWAGFEHAGRRAGVQVERPAGVTSPPAREASNLASAPVRLIAGTILRMEQFMTRQPSEQYGDRSARTHAAEAALRLGLAVVLWTGITTHCWPIVEAGSFSTGC